MSIIFRPKIPETFQAEVSKTFSFGSGKMQSSKVRVVKREQMNWSESEILKLVELRSLKVSFVHCATLLGRSPSSCAGAVVQHSLYAAITKSRKSRIAEALK